MSTGEKVRLDILIAKANNVAAATQGQLAGQTSGVNTAQTLTVAAPGANKRLHILGVFVTSSNSADLTATITVQQGGAATLVLQTGTGAGLFLQGVDIVSDENQTVTVGVPAAGGGATSLAQVIYYVETL